MKIISSFHDYYDTATGYAYERDPREAIYFREETTIIIDFNFRARWNYNNVYEYNDSQFSITVGLVGFCGKIYYGIRIYRYSMDTTKYVNQVFYSVDAAIEFIKKQKGRDPVISMARSQTGILHFTKWFNMNVSDMEKYPLDKFFEEYRIPVFTAFIEPTGCYNGDYIFTADPNLGAIQFFRLFRPSQAWQEIDMFFNSVLVSENNPPQITDNMVKIEKGGFDKRVSFRHRK